MNKNKVKIRKPEHAFKGFVSIYNAEILNSFNPELQLKDTESAIKNKLTELFTQLKGFKFVKKFMFKRCCLFSTGYGLCRF